MDTSENLQKNVSLEYVRRLSGRGLYHKARLVFCSIRNKSNNTSLFYTAVEKARNILKSLILNS